MQKNQRNLILYIYKYPAIYFNILSLDIKQITITNFVFEKPNNLFVNQLLE